MGSPIQCDITTFGKAEIAQLRRDIFELHGYSIIRNFCSLETTKHIRKLWHCNEAIPADGKGYWKGRGDYRSWEYAVANGKWTNNPALLKAEDQKHPVTQRYDCFFWNTPHCSATYDLAWHANILRNLVSGFPPYYQIFPLDSYAVMYRPTRDDIGASPIRRHNDRRHEEEKHVLQITQMLSTPGVDFEGGGMFLDTIKDGWINIMLTAEVKAGDLIVWDQGLDHEVPAITASDPHDPLSGSWRILCGTKPFYESEQDWVSGSPLVGGNMPQYMIRDAAALIG